MKYKKKQVYLEAVRVTKKTTVDGVGVANPGDVLAVFSDGEMKIYSYPDFLSEFEISIPDLPQPGLDPFAPIWLWDPATSPIYIKQPWTTQPFITKMDDTSGSTEW